MFRLTKVNFGILAIFIAYFTFAQCEIVEIEMVAKVEKRSLISQGSVYGTKSCGKMPHNINSLKKIFLHLSQS